MWYLTTALVKQKRKTILKEGNKQEDGSGYLKKRILLLGKLFSFCCEEPNAFLPFELLSLSAAMAAVAKRLPSDEGLPGAKRLCAPSPLREVCQCLSTCCPNCSKLRQHLARFRLYRHRFCKYMFILQHLL